MRLIDADALREYLGIETSDCTKCKDGFSIYGYCKRGGDFQTACYAIDIAPTVDAVPVRCKDCKYNPNPPECGNADCVLFYGMTDQMGFCHHGERREQDETD